ncbi:LysR substrate-binding domain-containing protein [Luteimonas saliphila]|uniref:LysR substrate-binding domain-containing protein n=1 Tax=Luteimonas saliphila TaxID=2804919 RepID=UPI00192D68BA|nr:LysR substrate-binding domain-containing protein [Luteimonas saliphila]
MNPNDLLLFAAAVEHGGFAAASRQLGIPKSTISKRVAQLEAALGVRLIQRTSRSFQLTEVGRDFHEHARAARIEMDAAEEVVRRRVAEPSGTVRLTASMPVAQGLLAGLLPQIASRYPALRLDLDVTDRFVDLVQEGYDLAVRSHFAPLPDSGLVQRLLHVEPVVLVAAPAYLSARGEPQAPEDLQSHDGVLVGTHAREWILADGSGRRVRVAPRPRMTANESVVLLSAAAHGLGIAPLPAPMCRDAIASGALRRVLPDWQAGEVTTTVVMPHRRGMLPAVRAVLDHLVAHATPE